jgi:hypothetical protein
VASNEREVALLMGNRAMLDQGDALTLVPEAEIPA